MKTKHPLQHLIDKLTRLPGIGPKSAQRLAFYFLSLTEKEVIEFAQILVYTKKHVQYCKKCFNLSFSELCNICQDNSRNQKSLCIVAEPKDILAIERIPEYKGIYHILGGLISPIDGIHPDMLRIKELKERIKNEQTQEIIFAINPSIEGDATILYLTALLKEMPVKITRLAHGLPMGGDIDYADELTLQKAFQGRQQV